MARNRDNRDDDDEEDDEDEEEQRRKPPSDDDDDDADDEEEEDDDSSDDELARLRKTVAKLRPFERQFKKLDRENRRLVAEQKKAKTESETEAQRKLREADEAIVKAKDLERKLQERDLRDVFYREARRQGAVDEEAVWKLIDMDDIDVDEDTGRPTNARDLVKELLSAKKYLTRRDEDEDDEERLPNGRRIPQTSRTGRDRSAPRKQTSEDEALERLRRRGSYSL